MRTSEQINELASALAAAQATMQNPVKDSENPHFRNDYASLAAVLDAIREPLSKNKLSLLQATKVTPEGLILVSRLSHASGQWIESETPLMLVKQDMQGLGSAITYARRYAAAAMCGVAQADDDGEGAAGRTPPKKPEQPQQPAAQAPQQQAPAARAPVAPRVSSVTRVGVKV